MASAAVRSEAVVLMLLIHCLLLLPFVFGSCFVVRYLVLFLVLPFSLCEREIERERERERERESWSLYFNRLLMSCEC